MQNIGPKEQKAMEPFAELDDKAIKTEVRAIIAELNVALSFLREANETPDAERQRQLIKYAQIVHHAVVRLLLGLTLSGIDETGVTIRLQIRAGLKNHGVSVGWLGAATTGDSD
jgi:hypothetical protein